MDENQSPAPESNLSPGKWIGPLVAALILAEGIWGFLVSLTRDLLLPLLARGMGGDPQSALYLGKGDVDVVGLFNSVLALCLAGIVFAVLYQWSRRTPGMRRVKVVRVVKKAAPASAAPLSITAPAAPLSITPTPVAAPVPATNLQPAPTPAISPPPVASHPAQPPPPPVQAKPVPPPVAAPAKPAKPKPPKEVYYNIVGEPINPTEDD